jgi:sugar lactone lactonase YvrE
MQLSTFQKKNLNISCKVSRLACVSLSSMTNIKNFKGYGALAASTMGLFAGMAFLSTLEAASPNHFDVIVADSQATIYAVNPRTGERAIVAHQDKLDRPYDVAADRNGNIIVSDTGTLRIVHVNLSTHEQTVLAEGGSLGVPYGIDADQNGRIYVANSSSIVSVNPETGLVETIAEGGHLSVPLDVAVANDGNLYVADAVAGVVRIDPVSKQQTLIAHGGFLHTPTGITVDANQTAYVVDGAGRCIVAVNLRKGSQSVVSMAGLFATPVGIALAPGGTMLVSDPDAFDLDGGIMVIEQDGTQKPISRGCDELVNARGIAIVPALSEQNPKSIR